MRDTNLYGVVVAMAVNVVTGSVQCLVLLLAQLVGVESVGC